MRQARPRTSQPPAAVGTLERASRRPDLRLMHPKNSRTRPRHHWASYGHSNLRAPQLTGTAPYGHSKTPPGRRPGGELSYKATSRQDHGSNLAALVEVAGIEPASSGGASGLLRAQPAPYFSAPPVPQAGRCGPSHCFDVPRYPVTGWRGDPPSDARSWAGGAPRLTVTYISSGREGVTGGNRLRLVGSYFF